MKKVLVLGIALVFLSHHVLAFNTQLYRPYIQGTRFFSLIESKPNPKDTLTLGMNFNYAVNPFELGNSNGNSRAAGVVDGLATFDFGATYSFSDKVGVSLMLPMHITDNMTSITTLISETNINLGDVALAGVVNIIEAETNRAGIGFAVAPFFTFPTGKLSDFVGDSNVTAGFLLVSDVDLNGHFIDVNLGFRFRQDEAFPNLNIGHELLYGVGYHYMISQEQAFSGFAELQGATQLEQFFSEEIATPVEGRLGVSKSFLQDNALTVKAGAGMGVGSGYGGPDFRGLLNVSYDHFLPRAKKKVVYVEKPVRIKEIEKKLEALTIYYPTDGYQVDPFYDQKIAGIAKILKDNDDLGPIYIVSHTDDVGSDAYNQKLSERRSNKAVEQIVKHSISTERVVSFGVGETDHIATNDSDSNRALNRRTLFTFEKPKQLMATGEEAVPYWQKKVGYTKDGKDDSFTNVLKQQSVTSVTPVNVDQSVEQLVLDTEQDKNKSKNVVDTNVVEVPQTATIEKADEVMNELNQENSGY